MKLWFNVVWLGMCAGCGAVADPGTMQGSEISESDDALVSRDFNVDFSNCNEFVGIGNVLAANARPLVPAHYQLAGDAKNAVIVVRVVRCASSVVDGHALATTGTAQIGIGVTGQDTTANINNYTLYFATDQALLHAKLTAAGAPSDNAKAVVLTLSKSGQLVASASAPHLPAFIVQGPATAPTAAPVQFIASWWADGPHGVIRERSVFPAIRFGTSTATLTTPAHSALANLIGGTTLTFPLLDSYNTFPSAHLEVRDTD